MTDQPIPTHEVISNVLSADEVGQHLGVKGATVLHYLYESLAPSRRYGNHPFPAPAGRVSGIPYWTLAQLPDIYIWANTRSGQGARVRSKVIMECHMFCDFEITGRHAKSCVAKEVAQ